MPADTTVLSGALQSSCRQPVHAAVVVKAAAAARPDASHKASSGCRD